MSRRKERQGKKKGSPTTGTRTSTEEAPGLTPMGMGLGAGGVIIAILGFWLLTQGSITAAPILLVLAYLVLIPLALIR